MVNMKPIGVFGSKLGFKLLTPSQTRFACKLTPFSLTSYPCKRVHCVPLKAIANPLACEDEENNRKFITLDRAEWDHEALFSNLDFSKMDAFRREIDALKPQVRDMFMSSKGITKKIMFIYLLKTLGVAYHFNDEIVETLKDGFQKIEEIMAGEDDLHTVSVIFYIFRTYGHKISSDVFARFKGNNGEFKESLKKDAKGILSLYEAANMGTTTDYILNEALSFTLLHLESLAANGTCKHNIIRCIQDGLYLPQHKNMEIIIAMQNIPLYAQEENCDKTLLTFAELNFKSIQLQFTQELKILTKWYKDHDIGSKLPPYYRDIIVEMNFVTLAYMEPKYSRVRIMVTKLFVVQLLIDDTCDRYASLREVETLANAIERWDHNAMDEQPEYLKYVVKFIIDTYQEYERELASEVGGSYSVNATIESCKTFMRANLQLAKWAAACHVPSIEEYLDVAGIEIAIHYTIAGILMGMKDICKKEAYEWLESRDKFVRLIATKTRLMNDMYGIEDDNRRGYVTSSVNCYKKQYGVTEEEALTKLHQMLVDIDKMMNEEMLKTISVTRDLLNVAIDCLRSVNVIYQTDDGFTRPTELIKSYVKSLYVDP